MRQEQAESIAVEALTHIAGEERWILGFIQQAGLSPDQFREQAGNPEFLAGVLDFVLADEAVAESFCTAQGMTGEDLFRARRALPGASMDYV